MMWNVQSCKKAIYYVMSHAHQVASVIARFMRPTWGPSGADMTQVGPMLAPWTLLSGITCHSLHINHSITMPWNLTLSNQNNHHKMVVHMNLIIMLIIHLYVHSTAASRSCNHTWCYQVILHLHLYILFPLLVKHVFAWLVSSGPYFMCN